MDVERRLISKAIEAGDMTPILEAHITEKFFQGEDNARVLEWMIWYWDEHHDHPTEEALHRELPWFVLEPCREPYDYYIHEVREDRRYEILDGVSKGLHEALGNGDLTAAVRGIEGGLDVLNNEIIIAQDRDITEIAKARMEDYMTPRPAMLGIPTGFPTMDRVTSGLQPEQLVVIVGPPKAGKSTMAMMMGIAAHEAANSVLGVTFEMSNNEQVWRHDALRSHVSYNRLTRSNLTRPEIRKLKDTLRKIESMRPFIWVHDASSTTTVSAVGAKAVQYQPNLLIIDGAYMMEAPGNFEPQTPQALTAITRATKRLAQRLKIPIIMTTQALTWKLGKRKSVTIDSIGYTSSFAQDADVIFGVENPGGDNESKERILRVVAARNAPPCAVRILWDWEAGKIEEQDEAEHAGEGDQIGDDQAD